MLWRAFRIDRRRVQPVRARRPAADGLEPRAMLDAAGGTATAVVSAQAVATQLLTADDVKALLQRASAASASRDAIIAVVDRGGNILGVRVEDGVDPAISGNTEKRVFAVDGAISKARTGAFFGNNQAPLTARTIQLISQTTMVERVINSDPNILDPNSPERGPGFVAPVGIKGHFPPKVKFTPQVDLFAIEHTNRDSIVHPGADHIKGTADDITLPNRFNVPSVFIPPGVKLNPPESYGLVSGLLPTAQSRGMATLPGGIPLYKNGQLVGGIGVFFPGKTGYATEENSQLNSAGFYNPHRRDRSQEAEFMSFVAAGGSKSAGYPFGAINGAPALPGFTLPFGRIDLVGISLDLFGGHGLQGIGNLLTFGRTLGKGDPNEGIDLKVNTSGDQFLPGQPVPSGWLVTPHDGTGLTATDVSAMIARGIAEANRVRAAIRLPLDSTAKMVFAVSDKDGNLLGLYRMPDATVFSIDVAVAKSRNVSYYADPAQLQPEDRLSGIPAGAAFTNRTFRYVTLPHFPEGIDGYPPGPFSIRNDPGIATNGRTNQALAPSAYTSIQAFDAFNPGSNFHDPVNPANQNGIVFFPGSAPLYKSTGGDARQLVGGLGVSGDGVDQDDNVTYQASLNFQPPGSIPRADQVRFRNVRLPYIKFNRQPHEPIDQTPFPADNLYRKIPSPRKPHIRSKT